MTRAAENIRDEMRDGATSPLQKVASFMGSPLKRRSNANAVTPFFNEVEDVRNTAAAQIYAAMNIDADQLAARIAKQTNSPTVLTRDVLAQLEAQIAEQSTKLREAEAEEAQAEAEAEEEVEDRAARLRALRAKCSASVDALAEVHRTFSATYGYVCPPVESSGPLAGVLAGHEPVSLAITA